MPKTIKKHPKINYKLLIFNTFLLIYDGDAFKMR